MQSKSKVKCLLLYKCSMENALFQDKENKDEVNNKTFLTSHVVCFLSLRT